MKKAKIRQVLTSMVVLGILVSFPMTALGASCCNIGKPSNYKCCFTNKQMNKQMPQFLSIVSSNDLSNSISANKCSPKDNNFALKNCLRVSNNNCIRSCSKGCPKFEQKFTYKQSEDMAKIIELWKEKIAAQYNKPKSTITTPKSTPKANPKATPKSAPKSTPTPTPTPTPKPTPAHTPTPTSDPQPDVQGLTADEQKMLDLINQARKEAGVAPLMVDMNLVKSARLKSQDMVDKNYFDHQSPTYGDPAQMIKKYAPGYRATGENIAYTNSVESAHKGLMNSSGHRQNILSSNYTHIGIGIVKYKGNLLMFTQQFGG